jgi:hypothetical protein
MIPLSYTLSHQLVTNLAEIDALRTDILLHPIPPKIETSLRFDAMLSRLSAVSRVLASPRSADQLYRLVFSRRLAVAPVDRILLGYKQTLEYLAWEYAGSQISVSIDLVDLLIDRVGGLRHEAVISNELSRLLEYLESATDHPVIRAGIALTQIKSPLISRLVAYLYLLRQSYDGRGLVIIENYSPDVIGQSLTPVIRNAIEGGNLTLWLEMFSQLVTEEFRRVQKLIASVKTYRLPKDLRLSDRQIQILLSAGMPNMIISNKTIQSICKVSQITASRELAKLVALGLLASRGKGRSVVYTRV